MRMLPGTTATVKQALRPHPVPMGTVQL